jgi:hypothetical protein
VAKFVGICASRNDLFALDGEGKVYQYNFNVKLWQELRGDGPSEPSPTDGRAPSNTTSGEPSSRRSKADADGRNGGARGRPRR